MSFSERYEYEIWADSIDKPLEDSSYTLFLPMTKIIKSNLLIFQMRMASYNNFLVISVAKSLPIDILSLNLTAYTVGGIAFAEDFYKKVKNYFSPKASEYDPTDKRVPR